MLHEYLIMAKGIGVSHGYIDILLQKDLASLDYLYLNTSEKMILQERGIDVYIVNPIKVYQY